VPQIDRVVPVRIFIGKILAVVYQVNEAVLYKIHWHSLRLLIT